MNTLVVNCFQITTLVEDSQAWAIFLARYLVVNCFQITTLVEDSQDSSSKEYYHRCCELLSDYYFSRRFTGKDNETLITELL